MKPATREWVRCAEEDFEVATALMRRRTKTAANSIGFHCQQRVEKYFKARLEEAGSVAPRTPDLVALLQLLLPAEPLWASYAPSLRRHMARVAEPDGIVVQAPKRRSEMRARH